MNPNSHGYRMSMPMIISCEGGQEGLALVAQISRGRGPLREFALGRHGDCSLSPLFLISTPMWSQEIHFLRGDSETSGSGWLV